MAGAREAAPGSFGGDVCAVRGVERGELGVACNVTVAGCEGDAVCAVDEAVVAAAEEEEEEEEEAVEVLVVVVVLLLEVAGEPARGALTPMAMRSASSCERPPLFTSISSRSCSSLES